ncbi:MAG: spore coat protein [Limnochordales bacterium]|nr:spore coat protein [Limnochordales bacterium]
MQDKDIASDMLNTVKMGIQSFTQASIEAANPQLRQLLVNLRNQCEQTQWQLFELARTNNWYHVPPAADPQYVQRLAQTYREGIQGMQAQQGAATAGVGSTSAMMQTDGARRN